MRGSAGAQTPLWLTEHLNSGLCPPGPDAELGSPSPERVLSLTAPLTPAGRSRPPAEAHGV